MGSNTLELAATLLVLLSACGGPSVQTVIWPELEAHELAFIIATKDGVRQSSVGPVLADGPGLRVQLSDSDDVHLVVVDTEALRALNPRVDDTRWSELQIIEAPSECAECASTCRVVSNELLYHPLGPVSRSLHLVEDRFDALTEDPWASLWIQIPARWSCVDRTDDDALQVHASWTPGLTHRAIRFVNEQHLLALTDALRVVGAEPELLLYPPAGSWFRDVVGMEPGRLFASVPRISVAPGAVFEIAIGPGRLEVIREIPMPFAVTDLYLDQMGLVVVGAAGSVATSTDGVSFRFSRVQPQPDLSTLARFGVGDSPYLLGHGSGGVIRGNPWKADPGWISERVSINVDSTTVQFLETQHPGSAITWARTVERGFYIEREGETWAPLAVEMPSVHPRCRLRTNSCGFGEPPARSRSSAAKDHLVFSLADNCPALLVFDLEAGCTSSLELREGGEPIGDPAGLAVRGDEVYLLLPGRVLRASISAFF